MKAEVQQAILYVPRLGGVMVRKGLDGKGTDAVEYAHEQRHPVKAQGFHRQDKIVLPMESLCRI